VLVFVGGKTYTTKLTAASLSPLEINTLQLFQSTTAEHKYFLAVIDYTWRTFYRNYSLYQTHSRVNEIHVCHMFGILVTEKMTQYYRTSCSTFGQLDRRYYSSKFGEFGFPSVDTVSTDNPSTNPLLYITVLERPFAHTFHRISTTCNISGSKDPTDARTPPTVSSTSSSF
jgi:hypothetical protein